MNFRWLFLLSTMIMGCHGCVHNSDNTINNAALAQGSYTACYSLSNEPGKTIVKCLDWYLKIADTLNTLWCATTFSEPLRYHTNEADISIINKRFRHH